METASAATPMKAAASTASMESAATSTETATTAETTAGETATTAESSEAASSNVIRVPNRPRGAATRGVSRPVSRPEVTRVPDTTVTVATEAVTVAKVEPQYATTASRIPSRTDRRRFHRRG